MKRFQKVISNSQDDLDKKYYDIFKNGGENGLLEHMVGDLERRVAIQANIQIVFQDPYSS